MLSLRDQVKEQPSEERVTGRLGILTTYVEAHIRGNYLKGSVPVSVAYRYYFKYEEPWLDPEGNTILATEGSFNTAAERDFRVNNFFSVHHGS